MPHNTTRPSAIAAPERQTSPPDSPSPRSYQDGGQPPPVPKGLNKYSRTITQPKAQGASQAQLFGTGLREEDLDKPQVGLDSAAAALCAHATA